MIIQSGGIDAVEKQLAKDECRSERLTHLSTSMNYTIKRLVVEILGIFYDRINDCAGTLITESGEKIENMIEWQDVTDAFQYTVEEIKNGGKNVY